MLQCVDVDVKGILWSIQYRVVKGREGGRRFVYMPDARLLNSLCSMSQCCDQTQSCGETGKTSAVKREETQRDELTTRLFSLRGI